MAAVCAAFWRGVLPLYLFGWDSYPLILAGRVHSLREVLGTFGEELMEGRYPLGHFYRPLVHLAFAFDHARAGLNAHAYHGTDLALAAVCCALMYASCARLCGQAGRWPALLAALAAAVHPVWLEILPVPARRAEILCVLFSLAAYLAQPSGCDARAHGAERARRVLAAVLAVAALLSKETGAMATGFVAAWAFASARARAFAPRLREALAAAAPTLMAFAAAFALRMKVLAGLGGSAESSLTAHALRAPLLLRDYVEGLLVPSRSLLGGLPLAPHLLLGMMLAALAVWARAPAAAASNSNGEPASGGGIERARAVTFVALAALVLAAITSVSGLERGWYALPFLPLVAFLLALLAAAAPAAVTPAAVTPAAANRSARAPLRAGAAARTVLLSLGALSALASAASIAQAAVRARDLTAFASAGRQAQDFLDRLEAAVVGAPNGTTLRVQGLVTERRADPEDAHSPNLLMLAPYSVEAWAQLRLPQRRVRFALAGRGAAAPEGDEVLVILAP